jgi:hypothetical protein
MVNASELYGAGGDFLNVETARNKKLLNKWLTIKEAEVRPMNEKDFTTGEEKTVNKIVLAFNEMDYELPLNKTNARRLIADISPESDDWVGKPIKLKVQTWGNGKEGIVIKSKQELADDGEEIPSPSSSLKQSENIPSIPESKLTGLRAKNPVLNGVCNNLTANDIPFTKDNIMEEALDQLGQEVISPEGLGTIRRDLKLIES